MLRAGENAKSEFAVVLQLGNPVGYFQHLRLYLSLPLLFIINSRMA